MNPESPLARFYHPLAVRFADTDAQGHVFFGNYFTYMDEAYMAYMAELGFSWASLAAKGLGLFYVDSGCQFRGPSYFGERLHVHTAISEVGHSSMTAEMTVVRAGDRNVVANGYIKGVLVDPRTQASTRIPDEFRKAVAAYQDGRPPAS